MHRHLQVFLTRGCRRFFFINLLWAILVFTSLLAIAGSSLLFVCKVIGTPLSVIWVALPAAALGFLVSLIYALATAPSLYKTAIRIDRLGNTGDILHTAWEYSLRKNNSAFSRLLLRKATTFCENLSVRKLIRLPSNTLFFPITAVLVALLFLVLPFSHQQVYSDYSQRVAEYREFSPEEIRRFHAPSMDRRSEKEKSRILSKEKMTVSGKKRTGETPSEGEKAQTNQGDAPDIEKQGADRDSTERKGGMGDGAGDNGESGNRSESLVTSVPETVRGIKIKFLHPDTADPLDPQDKYSKFIFSSPSQVDIIIKQDRIPGMYHDVLKRYFTGN